MVNRNSTWKGHTIFLEKRAEKELNTANHDLVLHAIGLCGKKNHPQRLAGKQQIRSLKLQSKLQISVSS